MWVPGNTQMLIWSSAGPNTLSTGLPFSTSLRTLFGTNMFICMWKAWYLNSWVKMLYADRKWPYVEDPQQSQKRKKLENPSFCLSLFPHTMVLLQALSTLWYVINQISLAGDCPSLQEPPIPLSALSTLKGLHTAQKVLQNTNQHSLTETEPWAYYRWGWTTSLVQPSPLHNTHTYTEFPRLPRLHCRVNSIAMAPLPSARKTKLVPMWCTSLAILGY